MAQASFHMRPWKKTRYKWCYAIIYYAFSWLFYVQFLMHASYNFFLTVDLTDFNIEVGDK